MCAWLVCAQLLLSMVPSPRHFTAWSPQLFFALRTQYIRLALSQLPKAGLLEAWEVRLLNIACCQTARAALKAHHGGVLDDAAMHGARSLVKHVLRAVASAGVGNKSTTVTQLRLLDVGSEAGVSAMTSARAAAVERDIVTQLAALRGLGVFLPQGDVSKFATKATIMVPDLFVDVSPCPVPTCASDLVTALRRTVRQCDRLVARSYVALWEIAWVCL